MTDDEKPSNRLAHESSPYLLLHRHNPVDWYPWGEEALERARRLDKPIFLSVGYSTCYWCHVMERESFSDPRVAEVMNREFVNIKMDREERPELDEVYMVATQVMSGQGGWPNSLFLNPDLEPFFAGTYFPPEDRQGQPAFLRVLLSLAEAWRERRGDIDEQARSTAAAIKHHLGRRSAPALEVPHSSLARRSAMALERSFDPRHGGFGGAPKFPTPSNLFLLGEMAVQGSHEAVMLSATLDAMARGGIFDQLGGGFPRYATDAEWKIPHFEKMLYDNGLLIELYARQWERTGDPEMARVARETVGFLERELLDEEGFFWSALDAETDGEEGAYYVWTRQELVETLGEEDFAYAAPLLGFDGPPFFEGDRYVLHLPRPLADQASLRRSTLEDLHEQLDPLRRRLFSRRQTRQALATDDKVLADWNGMAIAGLATAARLLPEPAMLELAIGAAEAVLGRLRSPEGTLQHTWCAGEAKVDAFLSDYAFLVRGLLALHEASEDARWLEAARQVTEEQCRRLGDPLGGFFTSAARPDLLVRSKEVVDGAVPAANSVAVLNLLVLHERSGEGRWREHAAAALRAFATQLEQAPDGARMMSVAVLRYHADSGEVAELPAKVAGEVPGEAPGEVRETPMQTLAARAVRPHLELHRADEQGWRRFELSLEIEAELHLQANPASAEYLVPTEVTVTDAELGEVDYPAASRLDSGFAEEPIAVYEGSIVIVGKVSGEGTMHLSYQACSETGCLPVVRVDLPLRAGYTR